MSQQKKLKLKNGIENKKLNVTLWMSIIHGQDRGRFPDTIEKCNQNYNLLKKIKNSYGQKVHDQWLAYNWWIFISHSLPDNIKYLSILPEIKM